MSLTPPALVQNAAARSNAHTRAAGATDRRVRACMCAQRERGRGEGGGCKWHAMAQGAWQISGRSATHLSPEARCTTSDCAPRLRDANHSRLKLKHTDVHHRCTRALPCPTCAVRAPPSYLRMMSAFWSWNSRKPSNTMSPCGHGSRGATLGKSDEAECQAWQECRRTTPIQTRLRSFPRMWHNRLTPSKQKASSRPFPSILVTCAYSVQSGSEGWQACAGGACPTTAGHLDRPP